MTIMTTHITVGGPSLSLIPKLFSATVISAGPSFCGRFLSFPPPPRPRPLLAFGFVSSPLLLPLTPALVSASQIFSLLLILVSPPSFPRSPPFSLLPLLFILRSLLVSCGGDGQIYDPMPPASAAVGLTDVHTTSHQGLRLEDPGRLKAIMNLAKGNVSQKRKLNERK